MNIFALTFALMLAFVLAELLVLKYLRRQAIPWKEVISNLNSGHLLLWVFRGTEVLGFGFLLSHLNLHWVDRWHPVWQWLFAFIGWDLCFYWMHRMHHKLPLLWAVHLVHHQGEHFNLSLGIRNSWYSSLTSFPFVAILAVLGVPLEIFVAVSSFHYGVQLYNHTALVGKSGWFDRWLVTPSNHRVHHGTDPLYLNRNFGGTLLIWDKLFGTWQAEHDDAPMRYGLHQRLGSDNPLWINHPGLLRRFKTRFPVPQRMRRLALPEWYVGSGGVILFGLVIYYVDREQSWSGPSQWLLFACIFLATIALGGVSDGRRWGVAGWAALALGMPALFIAQFRLHDAWALLLFTLLPVHGLDGVRRLLTAHGHLVERSGKHERTS
jgi:sterol desaturase/sphingolipid hydroxylase (fatty acid hydroxylase superfamily)